MAKDQIHPNQACPKCGVEKLATAEFFPRWRGAPNGITKECRACRSAYGKLRYRLNPEPAKARAKAKRDAKPKLYGPQVPRGFKVCRACWVFKAATLEHFPPDKRNKQHKLGSPCRQCGTAQGAKWKARNQRAVKAQRENYREKNKAKCRAWRLANPERASALIRAAVDARRARLRGQPGGFTADDVRRHMNAQRGRCWWCQCELSKYEIDHRFPVSKGGSNRPDNIVISCPPCNRKKRAKMPWEVDIPRLL